MLSIPNPLPLHLKLPDDPETLALLNRIVVYTAVILYHTIWNAPVYHIKFAKNTTCLSLHIATGLLEYFRYWLGKAQTPHSQTILPDALDVLSSLIWSGTSFVLLRTLRRGDPRTTRPPYQAAACLRPLATIAAYAFRIPSLHTLSIYALEGFIWTRLAIFYFSRTPYLRGTAKDSTVYAISVPLAAVFSVHQSQVPGATMGFVLAMAYIRQLNEWVTLRSKCLRDPQTKDEVSFWKKYLVVGLRTLGFVELDELRAVSEEQALEKELNDEYVSKAHD
ncbi:uncharacterized protein BO95DRAFT_463303 [Aspergillus brunneoviolaceus CBS 621.78]|uniref:Uncharacterized protein n=1 Tax=Aspergillus brunneoviolaceus CBS 621.78 TaxID=1450534 RepID=A0ACD1GAU8_9EURO|nr:hypothetical protein BO95DRAFT_463303 [Aspergillus brunneoviolaceus CBS 621.78]RAH46249.1 hypothetical protein BO95DRAFT_463303 [Aspergillus brunneoviolaceus CBS 621.78]